MSLGRSTPRTMDLAAFHLGEVREARPGVFRHGDSLASRLARFFRLEPSVKPAAPTPKPRARRAATRSGAPK